MPYHKKDQISVSVVSTSSKLEEQVTDQPTLNQKHLISNSSLNKYLSPSFLNNTTSSNSNSNNNNSNDNDDNNNNNNNSNNDNQDIITNSNTPNISHYKTYKRRWIGLAGLALLNIITSWGWLSFSAISSDTAAWFNLSSETPVNWLSTVILFSYIVSSPIVTLVLTRYSVKMSMFVCAILTVIGNWMRYAGTYTQTFGLLMFGQILIGFAQPFALSSPTYYTDIWFTSKSRVSANAIASIANPFGGAISQLVGPAMVSEPGELKNFVLLTACVATAISLITLVSPSHPPSPPCESATVPKLPLRESLISLLKSPSFVLAFSMFSVYVGLFNAYSTFINQIMEPYGYSSDEAGYTGAILIVAGIISVAITSPILDRTHNYIALFSVALPIMAGCYIALNFTATKNNQLVGPFLVSGVLGAISFSLLPALLEWIQEQTSPVTPALSASLLWNGGQLLGAIFIISMDSLKYPTDVGDPPENMNRALIFQAIWASLGVIPIIFLQKFARPNFRVEMDKLDRGVVRNSTTKREYRELETAV